MTTTEQKTLSFEDKKNMATAAFFSNLVLRGRDRQTAVAEGIVKIQYGEEVGIGPMSALMGLHVVEGKISWGSNLVASRIKSSDKYDYRIVRHDEIGCTLRFLCNGEPCGPDVIFDEMDAKRAGKIPAKSNSNWAKYPKAMYFARALTAGARLYCPDIFHGAVYTPEEIASGEVAPELVDVETVEPVKPAVVEPTEELVDAEYEEEPPAVRQVEKSSTSWAAEELIKSIIDFDDAGKLKEWWLGLVGNLGHLGDDAEPVKAMVRFHGCKLKGSTWDPGESRPHLVMGLHMAGLDASKELSE